MIRFSEDKKSKGTVTAKNMYPGQTGVIVEDLYKNEPIMKVEGMLISLINGSKVWSGNPSFKIRLCDFELREIEE